LLTFHTRRHAGTSKRTHTQAPTDLYTNTQTFRKFPALRANWLKLAQRDNERKSKVEAEEKESMRKEQGNSREHKLKGFRWISSEEQIFHPVSQNLCQLVL